MNDAAFSLAVLERHSVILAGAKEALIYSIENKSAVPQTFLRRQYAKKPCNSL
jgi:hypothetical protein